MALGMLSRSDVAKNLSNFGSSIPQAPARNEEKTMIRKTRLYTPGPTPLLPAAQFAMAAADIHHRTPEFRALFQRCSPS